MFYTGQNRPLTTHPQPSRGRSLWMVSTLFIVILTACAQEVSDATEDRWPIANDGKADIYGSDSRREALDPSVPEGVSPLIRSVAMLFNMRNTLNVTESQFVFPRERFTDRVRREEGAPLCEDEAFADQYVSGYCTAFLITPQLVATAGHCVNGHTRCAQMGIAFNYAKESPRDEPSEVDRSDVYRCESIVGRLYNPFEEPETLESREYWYDWAVLKLDRPVEGRAPLKLFEGDRLKQGDPIHVLGHPHGLPMKFSQGEVFNDNYERYMNTSLDIYQGNSGSPAFDAERGEVHGIVIRGSGGKSFERSRDPDTGLECSASRRCETLRGSRGCTGNHVLRIDPIRVFTEPDLKLIEQHTLVEREDTQIRRYSFSFTEKGFVDFATIHLNGGAQNPQNVRVLLHHGDQHIEMISRPRSLPYGRWSATSMDFRDADPQGEWVIEVINEGDGHLSVEWAQVMLGYHAEWPSSESGGGADPE